MRVAVVERARRSCCGETPPFPSLSHCAAGRFAGPAARGGKEPALKRRRVSAAADGAALEMRKRRRAEMPVDSVAHGRGQGKIRARCSLLSGQTVLTICLRRGTIGAYRHSGAFFLFALRQMDEGGRFMAKRSADATSKFSFLPGGRVCVLPWDWAKRMVRSALSARVSAVEIS